MSLEEFVLSRKYNGKTTTEEKFSETELKKVLIEGLLYSRAKDQRQKNKEAYSSAVKKINNVLWGRDCFPRLHKKMVPRLPIILGLQIPIKKQGVLEHKKRRTSL